MRRVLVLSTLVLLARDGHASQLAFTVDAEELAKRSFGVLQLPFREYAQIYVDGDLAGDTMRLRARRGIALPPGEYRVTVRAGHSTGCEPFIGTAEIIAGARTTTLRLDDGTTVGGADLYLRGCDTSIRVVTSTFADATVLVDGIPVGETGDELRVRSGMHKIAIEAWEAGDRPRHWRYESHIEIRTSEDTRTLWVPMSLAP